MNGSIVHLEAQETFPEGVPITREIFACRISAQDDTPMTLRKDRRRRHRIPNCGS
jgi:hypothetical protein